MTRVNRQAHAAWTDPKRRVTAWGLVALAAAVCVVVAVVMLRPSRQTEAAPRPAQDGATQAFPAELTEGLVALGSRAAAQQALWPAAPPASHSSAAQRRPLLCGRLLPASEPSPQARAGHDLRANAALDARQWTARMLASPQPRVVAGALVQLERWGLLSAGATPAERAACRGDAACTTRLDTTVRERVLRVARSTRGALTRLALDTLDPVIYGAAAAACVREPAVGDLCQQVSVAEWSRLEPANMEAWLHLADEAQARGDTAGATEALHRASLSTGRLNGLRLLTEALQSTDSPDFHPAVRSLVWADVLGMALAAGRPGLSTAFAQCRADSLADANRHQTCDALAQAYLERGSTLLDHGAGLALGRRLGWPADRLAALETEAASLAALPEARLASDQPLSCAALDSLTGWVVETARSSPLDAARRLVAQAGAGERKAVLAEQERAAASSARPLNPYSASPPPPR